VANDIEDAVTGMQSLASATLKSGIEFKGFTKSITSLAAGTEGASKSWTTFSRLVSGTPIWALQNKLRAYLSIIAGFETRSKANSAAALAEQKKLVDSVKGYQTLSKEFDVLEGAMKKATASQLTYNEARMLGGLINNKDEKKHIKEENKRLLIRMKTIHPKIVSNIKKIKFLEAKGAAEKLSGDTKSLKKTNAGLKLGRRVVEQLKKQMKSQKDAIVLLDNFDEAQINAITNLAVYQKTLLATGDESLALKRGIRQLGAKKEIMDEEHKLRVRDAKRAYAMDEERVIIAIENAKKIAKEKAKAVSIANPRRFKLGKKYEKLQNKVIEANVGRKAKKGMKKQMAGEMREVVQEDESEAFQQLGESMKDSLKNALPILGPIVMGFKVIKTGFAMLNIRGMTALKFRGKMASFIKKLGPLMKMVMMYVIYAMLFIIAAAVIFKYLKNFYDILKELGVIDEIKELGSMAMGIVSNLWGVISSFLGGDYTKALDYLSLAIDGTIDFVMKAIPVMLRVAWEALLLAFDMVVAFIDKLWNEKEFREKLGKVILKILLVIAAVMLVNMLLAAAFAAIAFLAIPILIAVAIGALLVVLWKRYADPITSAFMSWSRFIEGIAIKIKDILEDDPNKGIYDRTINTFTGEGKGWFGGGMANGGVTDGRINLVGERGPELVRLPTGSRVHSNAESKKMGGVTNINITINAKDTSKAEMRRIANELGNMINNKMNRSGSHRTMG
tara:strand:+ start:1569 stop:3761 length:2193 start_codon:yes stop_codon:yes gene_type:complete